MAEKTDLQTIVAKGEFIRKLSLGDAPDVITSLVYETTGFQIVLSFKANTSTLTVQGFTEYCKANEEEGTCVEEMAQTIAADLFKVLEPNYIQVQVVRSHGISVRFEAIAHKQE